MSTTSPFGQMIDLTLIGAQLIFCGDVMILMYDPKNKSNFQSTEQVVTKLNVNPAGAMTFESSELIGCCGETIGMAREQYGGWQGCPGSSFIRLQQWLSSIQQFLGRSNLLTRTPRGASHHRKSTTLLPKSIGKSRKSRKNTRIVSLLDRRCSVPVSELRAEQVIRKNSHNMVDTSRGPGTCHLKF